MLAEGGREREGGMGEGGEGGEGRGGRGKEGRGRDGEGEREGEGRWEGRRKDIQIDPQPLCLPGARPTCFLTVSGLSTITSCVTSANLITCCGERERVSERVSERGRERERERVS